MNQFSTETEKQFFYLEKCKSHVQTLEKELGRKPTACVTTFGCQMNAKDSEKLLGILRKIGFEIIEDETADLVFFNTCTAHFA